MSLQVRGFDHVLCCAWRGDNAGPHSPEEARSRHLADILHVLLLAHGLGIDCLQQHSCILGVRTSGMAVPPSEAATATSGVCPALEPLRPVNPNAPAAVSAGTRHHGDGAAQLPGRKSGGLHAGRLCGAAGERGGGRPEAAICYAGGALLFLADLLPALARCTPVSPLATPMGSAHRLHCCSTVRRLGCCEICSVRMSAERLVST